MLFVSPTPSNQHAAKAIFTQLTAVCAAVVNSQAAHHYDIIQSIHQLCRCHCAPVAVCFHLFSCFDCICLLYEYYMEKNCWGLVLPLGIKLQNL